MLIIKSDNVSKIPEYPEKIRRCGQPGYKLICNGFDYMVKNISKSTTLSWLICTKLETRMFGAD